MCCFSQPVERVSDTKIFARLAESKLQYLVYEMSYAAPHDLAMILPIPSQSDDVEFIDLSGYPHFFSDVENLFNPDYMTKGIRRSFNGADHLVLKVHNVGSYEASFVPSLLDFDRLDPRFSIPSDVWRSIPGYDRFGFVVFKLRATTNAHVHPMAFKFSSFLTGTHPTEARLYFPTVHIHRGSYNPGIEEFDHMLYFQGWFGGERKSRVQPGWSMRDRSKGILSAGADVKCLVMRGKHRNEDTVLS